MEKKMFYNATPLLFERAKELRSNLTPAEMVLWGYLKTKPFGYKFRRQHPIGIYIADFFCYKLKLVIEVDGLIHDSEEVKKNDEEREKIIRAEGIKIIRFSNTEVMQQLEKVIIKIQCMLHE
jgi:imidazole glycerol-phosphate synthase subunit HisF